ncbi:MAG: ArsA-related P-loop ATPase [Actinomycetota bacterium]
MTEPTPLQGDLAALDELLANRRVLVVAGPGGVGKTTMAAALGVRAARHHDRRVVVLTVDPARRLAEALGMTQLVEEPILVPVGDRGRMWALMVDMARGWDRVVEATAPDRATVDRLFENRLYRTLTRRFIQSHDYIALDHLLSIDDDDRHDLVVIDTPPSRHAIDLIDAPGRMIEFFDSRLLRWLTAGAGSGLGGAAARPFLAVAERLLGGRFLTEIVEFFTLFSRLRPAFVERSRRVEARLQAQDTAYVSVTTTDPPVVQGCEELIAGLGRRERRPSLLVVNRLLPGLRLRPPADTGPGWIVEDLATDGGDVVDDVEDPSLRRALDALVTRIDEAELPPSASDWPTVAVPLTPGDLTDVAGLTRLLGSDQPPAS